MSPLTRIALIALALSSVTACSCASPAVQPMPLISFNCPVYVSDNSADAHQANDGSYDSYWRSSITPSVQQPSWIAYDLSISHPKQVIVAWYNDVTYPYDHSLHAGSGYNIPGDYEIDTNPALGGKVPVNGWKAVLKVRGNTYHSRTVLVNMTKCNWIRLLATASDGSFENTNVLLNLDVHDASRSANDTWLFLGDSITAGGMIHTGRSFGQEVHAQNAVYFPAQENGGIGGWKASDALLHIDDWLKVSPAHYVTLNYGTNDINTYPGDQKAVQECVSNLDKLAQIVLAHGRIPVIELVPWCRLQNVQANGPLLNDAIRNLCKTNPRILLGPDMFTFYQSHPNLISPDNLHPSSPTGMQAFRDQWANWACVHIYQ